MPTFGRAMREEVLDRITAENAELGAELAELRRLNPQAYRKELRKWGRAHDEIVPWRPSLASTAEMRSAPEVALEIGEGPEARDREVEAPKARERGESTAEARARLVAERDEKRLETEAARKAKEEADAADAPVEEKSKGKRSKKADAGEGGDSPAAEPAPKAKGKKKA